MVTDVDRVDLQRHELGVGLSRQDLPERDAELSVVRVLAAGLWRDPVDGVLVGPARSKNERRVLQLAPRENLKARRLDEATTALAACSVGRQSLRDALVSPSSRTMTLTKRVASRRQASAQPHDGREPEVRA